jgi:hypothetical protein
MAVADTAQWFPRVWHRWKTGVVGVSSALAVILIITLAESKLPAVVGGTGYLGWAAGYAAVWGLLGVGSVSGFLRFGPVNASFVVTRPGRACRRILGGLLTAVVAVFLAGVAGIWAGIVSGRPFGFLGAVMYAVPQPGFGSWTAFLTGFGFVATLMAVFVGPAVGALAHGVLQTTGREVVTPVTGIVAATAGVTMYLYVATADVTLLPVAAVICAGAGYGYERTGNLAVPMVLYGLASGLGVIVMALPTILSLYAEFGTTLP